MPETAAISVLVKAVGALVRWYLGEDCLLEI